MDEFIFSIIGFQGHHAFRVGCLEIIPFSICLTYCCCFCSSLDSTIVNDVFYLLPSLVACCLTLLVLVVTASTNISNFLFGSFGCWDGTVTYGMFYYEDISKIDTDNGFTYIIPYFMFCLTACDSLSIILDLVRDFFIIFLILLWDTFYKDAWWVDWVITS